MNPGPALIVPACERGRGGGHVSRSVFLLRNLNERGRDAFLWIPGDIKDDVITRFRDLFTAPDTWLPFILSRPQELEGRNWDCIVLDRFKTTEREFAFWAALSVNGKGPVPLIGIDEGGPCRSRFDFLIDLLPSVSKHKPNLSAPGLLPLPVNRRSAGANPAPGYPRVLISFGAEDSAGLGLQAARALISHSPLLDVTLIAPDSGGSGGMGQELRAVNVTGKIPDLKERLAEYDLLITHFGIGAFEAVYARVPVLLISPTPYHEKLARNAGFFTTNTASQIIDRKFLAMLGLRRDEIARRFNLEDEQREDLTAFVSGIAPNSFRDCPVCEGKAGPVLARFPEETYRRCPRCGTIYLSRLKPPPVEYEKDYFFDSYKKQYGKTYLEDFPLLVEAGRRRLAVIKDLLALRLCAIGGDPVKNPSLLDIGCAYGPFLAAASESGFSPCGIEPAEDAVRYIREELRLKAWRGFFPDAMREAGDNNVRYDAITLWYVIEHFKEPGEIFGEINRLLYDGGVLAFSTPSYSGISGRKSLHSFLKNSPPDHWTVFSPGSCRKILRHYGFRLRRIVVTGHHPERFPLLGRFVRAGSKNILFRLLLVISRLFRLGDTFEVYFTKGV